MTLSITSQIALKDFRKGFSKDFRKGFRNGFRKDLRKDFNSFNGFFRNLSFLCILAIAFSACNSGQSKTGAAGSKDSSYTLTGRLLGLDTGWVYLQNRGTDSLNPIPDSTPVKEGVFTFKGFAATPQFVLLGIRGIGGDSRIAYQLGFFLDRGIVSIAGGKDSLYKSVIVGSPAQDEYLAFPKVLAAFAPVQGKLDSLNRVAEKTKNQALQDSLQDAMDQLEQSMKQTVKNYSASHPASAVGAFEALEFFSYGPEPGPLDSIYKSLDPAIQNSWFGRKIKSTGDIAKKTAIGQPAPEFTQNDSTGHPVSLASFKGKYVLVDFWASWCGPCRRESPSLVNAYHQFHPKGFEILGVSMDDNKDNWTNAAKKDGLAWTQVSDLKGWQNGVAQLYGITAIPMNFLLDRQGLIVAKGLRGGQLDKKLAELLP